MNEFKDIVTFVEGKDGKKKPVRIGWAKVKDGKITGALEGVINLTFVIEDRRPKDDSPIGFP
jgi:hypothetical protein